ncbi:hypothetical protein PGAG_00169 [Phaeocystis globosa virus 12T]|uniref:Uncharacterized protein n=1 Tax=Phaeocystis globosa virus PgV-16T TaxID=3071227 RepID=A0AC59EX42_9VIRU|nr:hypothetical protein PGCG_00210 [Phaeocystis globosa virus]AET73058.1 hypothetical protein PGAG_00169 [Phaeocystis globosa virus 12T]AET73881.1 hypothetical protein PGBG_00173 [Phaeocystis globosa virus 14T]AGM15521.1 hypothetical protein PGCG_00210 [Phaeocystis globosa virus PgV-16T]UYE94251.1 hypothetical protein PGV14T_00210 [Phaeocystis globosa virus]
MANTKKTGVKFFKSGHGKKSTTQGRRYLNKKNKKTTKRIKLTIKNLGKRNKTNKRVKKMKGGGPSFQPFTDTSRGFSNAADDVYNTIMGNDHSRN